MAEFERSRHLPIELATQLSSPLRPSALERRGSSQASEPFGNAPRLTTEARARFHASLQHALDIILSTISPAASGDDATDDIYNGYAGYALLFLHLSRLWPQERIREKLYAEWAIFYASHALQLSGPDRRHIGFLGSFAGVLAVAAASFHRLRMDKQANQAIEQLVAIEANLSNAHVSTELLYGRAGYLYALLFVREHCGELRSIHDDLLHRVVESIVRDASQGNEHGAWMWKWHDKQYLGAAHGVAGILTVLLHPSLRAFVQPFAAQLEATMEMLISFRFQESGNYPSSVGGSSETFDELVQFCHGAPGFIPLFLRAHERYFSSESGSSAASTTPTASTVAGVGVGLDSNERTHLLRKATEAGEVTWARGLLSKGVGLCHGISGNALLMLSLWGVGAGDIWLDRAARFMLVAADWRGMQERGSLRRPDHPCSLFEGLAGAAYAWSVLLAIDDGKQVNLGFPCLGDV